MDTKVYKGISFNKEPILDVQTHKPTRGPLANVQKPFTYLWQPPGVKKCFIDGEALMGLRSVPLVLKPLLRKLKLLKVSKIAR